MRLSKHIFQCYKVIANNKIVDSNGNIVCGSWRVPSIWCVEKDENGEWFVEHIYEHP